ncbi:hypothetical protein A3SI_10984 [Nitritalea halalkaliphila LW7]|uniref:Uncharacterized protein n=1 Tax=Nitritalea halalkaliphila LW7 TaxID=1189621 RepID=I5C2V2_9BACT|nr:hypothetical protein [Nitritalea halalkaliphila]EIM76154.1 hypothetical protein A3SI_10984 [Nitritalea halalkaliphila LW7]
MYDRFTFLFLILLYVLPKQDLHAQGSQELLPKGARAAALGHASLTLVDGWALFNNPGALGLVTEASAVVGYDHRWQLAELSSLGAAYVHPLANGSVTVGASRFGGPHLHESKLKLAYAHR